MTATLAIFSDTERRELILNGLAIPLDPDGYKAAYQLCLARYAYEIVTEGVTPTGQHWRDLAEALEAGLDQPEIRDAAADYVRGRLGEVGHA